MPSELHPRKLTGANGKPISRSQWKDGFGGDSGPSRGDPCTVASRPKAKIPLGHVRPVSGKPEVACRLYVLRAPAAASRLLTPAMAGWFAHIVSTPSARAGLSLSR
jgi:hypothetical protein